MTISQQIQNLEKSLLKAFDNRFVQTENNLAKTFDTKFQQVEKNLLTQIDLKFAESSADLTKQLKFHEKRVLDKLEDKFEERQKVIRNDVLNFKDEIVTEVRGLRQEVTITSGRVTRLEKTFLTN